MTYITISVKDWGYCDKQCPPQYVNYEVQEDDWYDITVDGKYVHGSPHKCKAGDLIEVYLSSRGSFSFNVKNKQYV